MRTAAAVVTAALVAQRAGTGVELGVAAFAGVAASDR